MSDRVSKRQTTTLIALLLTIATANSTTAEDDRLRIFGYSQNIFQQVDQKVRFPDQTSRQVDLNSFILQQLNIFLQKPVSERWTSFVNLEMINSYSSFRRWGAFNLEEAWVRYRMNRAFSLKLGLQIPIFNHFNEIKNKTPLIPYIIRPLVYESSFNEIIPLDEFTPTRAFVQAYGSVPKGEAKMDYAVYLGNSPNINDNPGNTGVIDDGENSQTGIDTTATLLIGGRLGLRYQDLKFGVSATHDYTNLFQTGSGSLGHEPADFKEVRRIRLGTDLSAHFGDYEFESEYIRVRYDDDIPDFLIRLEFYYLTLGYQWTEELSSYVSYWVEEDELTTLGKGKIEVPNAGLRYDLTDGIALKVGYALAHLRDRSPSGEVTKSDLDFYTAAISAVF